MIVLETVGSILNQSWLVLGKMAPYLLFGFFVSGVLSVFISPAFVEEHLGKKGIKQIVKAALFGVPLPLCSCAVIPVSASLRQHGASKGATVSFLASTPTTGVDSVMVTYSLLGPVFVVYRVVVAFLSGIISGMSVSFFDKEEEKNNSDASCCHCHSESEKGKSRISRIFSYGFVSLPQEIGTALFIGIILSGILSTVIPENYFADKLGPGIVSMILVMLVAIPLYVCSTGSVPIALAMISMGLSPGAALVFLITGPATNAATITTIWKMMGKRTTFIYLATIALTALAAGSLLNSTFTSFNLTKAIHMHHPSSGWINTVSAVVLLIVLGGSYMRKIHQKCRIRE